MGYLWKKSVKKLNIRREYSFESLKFLWLEYGSMDFPQSTGKKP